jgi:hypothetical protein
VSLPLLRQLATGDQQGSSQPEKGCANDPSGRAHLPRVPPPSGRQPKDSPHHRIDGKRHAMSSQSPFAVRLLATTEDPSRDTGVT